MYLMRNTLFVSRKKKFPHFFSKSIFPQRAKKNTKKSVFLCTNNRPGYTHASDFKTNMILWKFLRDSQTKSKNHFRHQYHLEIP